MRVDHGVKEGHQTRNFSKLYETLFVQAALCSQSDLQVPDARPIVQLYLPSDD
jgi:hypothetical protein